MYPRVRRFGPTHPLLLSVLRKGKILAGSAFSFTHAGAAEVVLQILIFFLPESSTFASGIDGCQPLTSHSL